ncbi:MAG: hypothetical protein R3300_09070 [Candidatus Promineifilaceae bacterium]|nr:hypothetical protein [Candidatus Promineifilaceae bacterium]
MEKPLGIGAFWRAMQSTEESNPLMEALRKLSEITDPETVTTQMKKDGPSPLGSWGGWSI